MLGEGLKGEGGEAGAVEAGAFEAAEGALGDGLADLMGEAGHGLDGDLLALADEPGLALEPEGGEGEGNADFELGCHGC